MPTESTEPRTASADPSPLELLGALASLLVHDLNNHLCVISGNATLAQLASTDPAQVATSLRSIVKASERALRFLERTGEFRRSLADQLPPGDAADTVSHLRALAVRYPGWNVEAAADLSGPLALPALWIAYAVSRILEEARAAAGTLYVRKVQHGQCPLPLAPGSDFLEIRAEYHADHPVSIAQARTQLSNLGLLASFELMRNAGGKLEAFTRAPGSQSALCCVPFARAAADSQPPP